MEQRDIELVRELVNKSIMADVQYHELSVRREKPLGEDSEDPKPVGEIGLRPQFRLDDDSFGFRLIGEVDGEFGRIKVAVANEYEFKPGESMVLSQRLVKMFGNEVGLMALFPFFRESVASLSAKVFGRSLFVPFVERGAIAFDLEDDHMDENDE